MKQDSFSGSTGLSLAFRTWQSEGPAKGVIVICHGYTEHGGRYQEFAEFLTSHGYHVFVHDHVGHGLSEGIRAHIRDFNIYVDDVRIFIDLVRTRVGVLPVFLFGQSMGAIIALLYTARFGSGLAGLILSAPALIVALKISPFLRFFSKVFAAILPKAKFTKGVAEDLSRDHRVIVEYKNDPLVYTGRNRARIGYLLLQLEETVPPEIPNVSVPLLVMHGTEDRITDPKSSRLIYENAGSTDKTLKWFNALYHEILHEPEKREVMKLVSSWVEARS